MTDSIGEALQRWFTVNGITVDHPVFVQVIDDAFAKFLREVVSEVTSHGTYTFGDVCVEAAECGGKEEAETAGELMRRIRADRAKH